MKPVIKEFVDINQIENDPLIQFIKDYFEKKNNIQLIGIDTQGDQVVLALCADIESDEENNQYKREEAKQITYDIKYNLEKEIQDKYGFTPLSIRGLNVVDDLIQFEINFIYKNQPGKRIFEENNKKLTFKEEVTKELVSKIEKETGKKVILENYSIAQKKLAERVLNDSNVEYIINLINKLFLKKNALQADFNKFEKLHKNTLSKLINIRNNVTTTTPLEYPLGGAAAYQTIVNELKSIIADEEPVVAENNDNSNAIEFRNFLEAKFPKILKEAAVDHFWLVLKPEHSDIIEDLIIPTSIQEIKDDFETGLTPEDIFGAYTEENEATRIANKLLLNKKVLSEVNIENPEFESQYLDYEEMRKQQELKDLQNELDSEEENQ